MQPKMHSLSILLLTVHFFRLCEKNRQLVATSLAYTPIFQLIALVSHTPATPAQLRAVDVIDSLLSSPGFLSPESFPLVLHALAEFTGPDHPSPVAISAMRRIHSSNRSVCASLYLYTIISIIQSCNKLVQYKIS